MRKQVEKIVALTLSVVMLVGLLTVGTSAADAVEGYTDIDGNPYAHCIEALSEAGILKGVSDTKFGSERSVTRAEAVTVLGRMAGASVAVTAHPFEDVGSSYYTNYLGWAVEKGIIETGTTFNPDGYMSGAEMDAWLAAYAKTAGIDYTATNTSDAPITRAEMAGMVYFVWMQDSPDVGTVGALVKTDLGWYMGSKYDGVYSFLGMKYGEAERFQAAKKPAAWSGIHAATVYGAAAPESEVYKDPGNAAEPTNNYVTPRSYYWENEDCLYLNVWSTAVNDGISGETADADRPVLFFIHGGGLASGSANELTYYEGANFAKETGAVFVSVNSRLNILGYSNLTYYNDLYGKNYESNLGQKDLVLALEWVRDNIAQFGGDPDNVTVLGQSGGGMKVSGLLSSPYAEGLIDKAILCSGNGAVTSTEEGTQSVGIEWVELAGKYWGLTDEQEILAKLETAPYDELYAAITPAADTDNPWGAFFSTGPSTAGIVIDGDFIVESAQNADEWKGWSKDIPLIVSNAYAEMNGSGAFFGMSMAVSGYSSWMTDDEQVKGYYAQYAVNTMSEEYKESQLRDRFGDDYDALIAAFKKAYPDLDPIQVLRLGNSGNRKGDNALATVRVNSGAAPTYLMTWAYEFPWNGGIMAWHTGGDLPFIFHNTDAIAHMVAGDKAGAEKLADQGAGAIYNFMVNGDPSGPELPWDAFTTDGYETMVFGSNSECRSGNFDADLLPIVDAHPGGW